MTNTSFFQQYLYLMWKNWKLRIRRPFMLLLEIIAPIILIALLFPIIQNYIARKDIPTCFPEPRHLLSQSPFSWIKGMRCFQKLSCENHTTTKGTPPTVAKLFNLLMSREFFICHRDENPNIFGNFYFTPITNFTSRTFKRISDKYANIINDLNTIAQTVHSEYTFYQNFIPKDCWTNECKFVRSWMANDTSVSMTKSKIQMLIYSMQSNGIFGGPQFKGFDNETLMLEEIYENEMGYVAGVIIKNNTNNYQITIRMRDDHAKSTKEGKFTNIFWKPGDTKDYEHISDMTYFTYLQEIIGVAITEELTGIKQDFGISLEPFPVGCYKNKHFIEGHLVNYFGFFIVLGFLFSFTNTVQSIVNEKEMRLKEYLKVMGVTNHLLWLALTSTTLILLTISCSILVTVIYFSELFSEANMIIMLLVVYSYALSILAEACFMSSLFDSANTASQWMAPIYLISVFPAFIGLSKRPIQAKLLSLLPQVAFEMCFHYIKMYEDSGIGINWSNIFYSPAVDDSGYLVFFLGMLWFDSFIFLLLTWYIESVFPGQYGIAHVWYFPFTKSYWFRNANTLKRHSVVEDKETKINSNMEPDPTDLTLAVKITKLTKQFSGMVNPAVDKLSLNFYENQITSFLGHNGAGKTTTICILTGIYSPTEGSINIYGFDLEKNVELARNLIGYCPQHNILFDSFTVEEHIYFYGGLKGMPLSLINSEIKKMLTTVDLLDKRDALASSLSGGMKRKLSVALAFLGTSRLVILDEPTAGVDPMSRRAIWKLIAMNREDHAIILTTHHLDEADVLGDKVAILAQGKVCAVGSNAFLKERFGVGYSLNMVKKSTSPKSDVDTTKTNKLSEFIRQHVKSASVVSETTTEWLYKLPYDDLKDGVFSKFLKSLEDNLNSLGVKSFGISDATLEDVFLNTVDNAQDSNTDGNKSEFNDKPSALENNKKRLNNPIYIITRILGLWIIRFHYKRRNFGMTIWQFIMPVLILFLGAMPTMYPESKVIESREPLQLHPWHIATQINSDLNVFYSNDSSTFGLKWGKVAGSDYGITGTRCINNSIPNYPCISKSTKWSKATSNKFPACDCASGMILKCPSSGPIFPKRKLKSSDILHQIPHNGVKEWLLKTEAKYRFNRFGGFSFISGANDQIDLDKILQPGTFRTSVKSFYKNPTNQIIVWFNNKGYIAASSYLAILLNMIHKQEMLEKYNVESSLSFISYPIPRKMANLTTLGEEIKGNITELLYVFVIILSLTLIPCFLISFLIEETAGGSKHLQLVSGVNPFIYWIASYIWDCFNYTCIYGLCLAVIYKCGINSIKKEFKTIAKILFAYGTANLSMMYIFTFIFKTPSTAAMVLFTISIILGFVSSIGIVSDIVKNKIIIGIFRMIPSHNSVNALLKLTIFKKILPGNINDNINALIVSSAVYLIIVMTIECGIFSVFNTFLVGKSYLGPNPEEDDDVREERRKVLLGEINPCPIRLKELSKKYSKSAPPAVNNVCLSIQSDECFGLLGVNGAGKTTTFKMLTGNHLPSSGTCTIGPRTITNTTWMPSLGSHDVGYCPQFDVLTPVLTSRELLTFYARLRAIPESDIKEVVGNFLTCMDLDKYADIKFGTYSGGNKRKLSTAVALMGDPKVVLLDEPTSGMDVGARRFLWTVIRNVVQSGRTVVLTTHSMEECEALCQRLTIMVQGRLKCLGSVQHLKSKFGQSFNVAIKLKNSDPQEEKVLEMMRNDIQECVLESINYTMLQYTAPTSVSLSTLFDKLSMLNGIVERFSVSQASLDQIFIDFATESTKKEEVA